MFPDSRRPRRLAIVISPIETNAISMRSVVRGRDDRLDLGDRRCGRHGDRHDVVDEQGRRGDQSEDRQRGWSARRRTRRHRWDTRDRPGGRDRDDGEEDRDRDRDLDSTGASRRRRRGRGPGGSPPSRRRRTRSASELKMASAFVLDSRSSRSASLASGRPKTTPRTRAKARPSGGPRLGRCLSRDELARAGVSEVRGVRPLDPHATITGLSTGERPTAADHLGSTLTPWSADRGRALAGRRFLAGLGYRHVHTVPPRHAGHRACSPQAAQRSLNDLLVHVSRLRHAARRYGTSATSTFGQPEEGLADPSGVVVVQELLDPVARHVLGEQHDHDRRLRPNVAASSRYRTSG